MRNLWRGVAENLIAAAIIGVGGLIVSAAAIWVTYFTPAFRAFAPASYFFGALIALVLTAMLAERGLRAWRHYHPVTPEAAKTSIRLGKGAAAYDDTELRAEAGQLREALAEIMLRIGTVDRELRNLLDGVEDKLKALEEKDKVIIQDYNTVLGKQALAEENAAKSFISLNEYIDGRAGSLHQAIEAVKLDLGDVRRGAAQLDEKIKENDATTRESINAVIAKPELDALAAEIERTSDNELILTVSLAQGDNCRPGLGRMGMEWQPIETAPRGPSADPVLTFNPDHDKDEVIMLAQWNDYRKTWTIHIDGQHIEPTHWMPLPEPPEQP